MTLLHAPYPIPLKDWLDGIQNSWWTFYHAKLTDGGVEVANNIGDIYHKGFFGKGKISRLKKDSLDGIQILQNTEIESYDSRSKQDVTLPKLVLFFEEAFFLMYAVPCIILKDNDNILNIDQAWEKLSVLSVNGKFTVRYAVYHHFRAKGWVVKCGLKFGTDYVIYKDGPVYNHAQYAVLIRVINKEDENLEMSWLQLATLNRMAINCGKELLFCNVWVPEDTSTPLCLKNFKIKETLFKRWVGSEERSGTKTKDDKTYRKRFKYKPYSK